MTDIALLWENDLQAADIALDCADLAADDGMETAILISLFTDRRCSIDELPADGSGDRRGWWGDAFAEVEGDQIGSKLWLLEGRTLTAETLKLVQDYATDALTWLVEDGVAQRVDITVERDGLDRVNLQVSPVKPDGTSAKYNFVWNAKGRAT